MEKPLAGVGESVLDSKAVLGDKGDMVAAAGTLRLMRRCWPLPDSEKLVNRRMGGQAKENLTTRRVTNLQ